MFTVKTADGRAVEIGRRLLVQLAILDDQQIADCGYDIASVNAAARSMYGLPPLPRPTVDQDDETFELRSDEELRAHFGQYGH